MHFIRKVLCVAAVLALAGCGMMGGSGGQGGVSVSLSGAEEVPPVSATGSGTGRFTVGEDGSVSGSVTTTGVQGTMAHIHQATKGMNGPVIVPLTKSGDTYSVPAGAKLNASQMQAFKSGSLYVNVHTAANKGGEVRGQLTP